MNIIDTYKKLYREYGPQGWWPLNGKYRPNDYSHPKNDHERFEIIVGAILTQNTSWTNAEKALESLKQSNALNKKSIKEMHTDKLARIIKSAGYNNQKAKKLKKFLEFKGDVNRENLLKVWGIGPETADSILLYAYKKLFFVIDAYTTRIMSRLGLCKENTGYDELQEMFHKLKDRIIL